MNLDPPTPLTEIERAAFQAAAEKGNYPSLEIVRRFIATIRVSITSSPLKLAKTAKTRTIEPKKDDVDFF